MPSKQHQIVIRVTDAQLAWLQNLAKANEQSITQLLMTPFQKTYPEYTRLDAPRQWTRAKHKRGDE